MYWAMLVTALVAIILLFTFCLNKNSWSISLKQYGFVVNWKSILAGLVTALGAVLIAYLILFIIDAIFKTDFRIWTWAVKTFRSSHLVAALKYAPFFFLYFYVTGITVNANTGHMKRSEE